MAVKTRKRVAILSDSERLARAVELNLKSYAEIECVKLAGGPSPASSGQSSWGTFDLFVLAVGLLTTDPAALLNSALLHRDCREPMLFISNEPSRIDWGGEIYFLAFPFDAAEFHRQVRGILDRADERSVRERNDLAPSLPEIVEQPQV